MMIRSSVTISLVPEIQGGPFVFGDLETGCRRAAELGFDAVEVFPRSAGEVDRGRLKSLLEEHRLRLAAMGTGAGWAVHRRLLTHPDPAIRRDAREFVREIVDLAGSFEAPAIVGSMQGRCDGEISKERALGWLAEALAELCEHARKIGSILLFEPLNRYETNLVNRIADAEALMENVRAPNLRILADLFHMNIEEPSIAEALQAGGSQIGHVHFVDSNRWPAGAGHIDYAPVAAALAQSAYDGYLSAEAFPFPDADQAAVQTITTFRRFFGR